MRERFTTASNPGPMLVSDLGEGSETVRDTGPSLFRGPPSSPIGLRPRNRLGGEGRPAEGQDPALTSLSTSQRPFHCYWLSHLVNYTSLTVGCFWVGPTVTSTNNQAGPFSCKVEGRYTQKRLHAKGCIHYIILSSNINLFIYIYIFFSCLS